MYAALDRHSIKQLNRLDKRRRMKYDTRHKENTSAEELRATREEVGEAEVRYAGELSWAAHRNPTTHR